MKNTVILLTLKLSILTTSISFAQMDYIKDVDGIVEQTESVMSALEKLDFKVAFKELRKNWTLPENEIDQLESLTIKQFNAVSDRFGKPMGYVFIKDLKIKDFVLRKIYILKLEKHMIRVEFTYYNNGQGWMANGFKWGDVVDVLLKE